MTLTGRNASHVATVSPHPHDQAGTVWSCDVDGDTLLYEGAAIMYVERWDAIRAAEAKVGHAMTWREEA